VGRISHSSVEKDITLEPMPGIGRQEEQQIQRFGDLTECSSKMVPELVGLAKKHADRQVTQTTTTRVRHIGGLNGQASVCVAERALSNGRN